jgi:hypothetical protein
LKKKKNSKEREEHPHKGRVCAECGSPISEEDNERIYRKGFGQTYHFCSMDCYVVWEMRK